MPSTKATIEPVAKRLAGLRTLQGLSLEQLALKSGLTKSYLSKVERGISQPSIASLLKLAQAFGVPAGRLLDDEPEHEGVTLVRKQDRLPFSPKEDQSGYLYEAIAAHRTDKCMTPFIMKPPLLKDSKLELVSHAGEELIFLIAGEMEVVFKDKRIAMRAGDSLYFDASVPHRSVSIGKKQAEALVVVGTPK